MNALNRLALLAGGALVIATATGCSSSTKAAVSSAPAGTPTSAPGAPPAPVTVTVSAPGQAASTGAPAGGASTAPAADPSSTHGGSAGGTTGAPPAAAPTPHPACDNAKLNASLAPAVSGQKPSIAVIAVTNSGPTCTVKPLPYLWIVASPTDVSNETRPLVPEIDPTKQLIVLSGTTLYAAVDLNPGSAANAAGNYGFLEVTANPTKDTSGKDVQDVRLPAPAGVSNAMLGIYTTTPASAIDQIQYATTPEK